MNPAGETGSFLQPPDRAAALLPWETGAGSYQALKLETGLLHVSAQREEVPAARAASTVMKPGAPLHARLCHPCSKFSFWEPSGALPFTLCMGS